MWDSAQVSCWQEIGRFMDLWSMKSAAQTHAKHCKTTLKRNFFCFWCACMFHMVKREQGDDVVLHTCMRTASFQTYIMQQLGLAALLFRLLPVARSSKKCMAFWPQRSSVSMSWISHRPAQQAVSVGSPVAEIRWLGSGFDQVRQGRNDMPKQ